MQKLLYVAPHLSTGGLPQYLTKKIELLKDEFEIYLVEWDDCTGGRLVVQRNKILSLLDKNHFFTLGEDKQEFLNIVNKINPDIIHLEEIPEFFMDDDITRKLYSIDRDYFLVETSHDSSFNVSENKLFTPDKFMFVSNWQIDQYINVDIPKILVEYPIEYTPRPDREIALKRLNLTPLKKHILHIGLFTSRKNQKEFFEYARSLPEYEFHSVGNQADNFKWYWEPLMKDKPDNLTWWDERTDVESFYQSMDLFLFTSRGSENDKETMPLVIREALSYQIPQLLYNLEVYQNYFNDYNSINYLDFNNFENNVKMIREHFNNINKDEIFIISTYPNSRSVIETTKRCINSIKSISNRKVILTSHIPIPEELSKLVDYTINDNNNILTKHSYYCNYFNSTPETEVQINLRSNENDVYHGPSCYSNYHNGAALANNLGFEKVFFLNYDYILYDTVGIDKISEILNKKEAYLGKFKSLEGDTLYTYFLGINSNFYLNTIPKISNAKDYELLRNQWGSESNGYENMMYHAFKNIPNIYYEDDATFNKLVEDSFIHEDFSRVEYYTVLPTNIENQISPYIRISNAKESKTIQISLLEGNKETILDTINIQQKIDYYKLTPYIKGSKIKFLITDTSGIVETKILSTDNLENNGILKLKEDKLQNTNPQKVKIFHLLTQPDEEREQLSIESISKLGDYPDVEYTQIINEPYTELPPKENCLRPDDIQMEPGHYKLSPGHYGCYKAHADAILSCPKEENTVYLFFECDAILMGSTNEFIIKLKEAINISKEYNYTFFHFGDHYEVFNEYKTHIDGGMFTETHAYLIMGSKIDRVHNVINNGKWDVTDLWITNNFNNEPKGFFKSPITFQAEGYSYIEKKISGTNIKEVI